MEKRELFFTTESFPTYTVQWSDEHCNEQILNILEGQRSGDPRTRLFRKQSIMWENKTYNKMKSY